MGESRNVFTMSVGKPKDKNPRWEIDMEALY